MKKLIKKLDYFSKAEKIIWVYSVLIIIFSSILFGNNNLLILLASLIGVSSLLLNAKGNPLGQIIFSIICGIISFGFDYYGDMITYLLMTLPMAIFPLFAWIKNSYNGNLAEVKVNTINKKELIYIMLYTIIITIFFVLRYYNTANIIPSTISVSTSFLAAALTYKRSHYFALAYAANDIVLIILWVLANIDNFNYISVVICFIAFLLCLLEK